MGKVVVAASLRRLACPTHGVLVEACPLATTTDQTAICRLASVD